MQLDVLVVYEQLRRAIGADKGLMLYVRTFFIPEPPHPPSELTWQKVTYPTTGAISYLVGMPDDSWRVWAWWDDEAGVSTSLRMDIGQGVADFVTYLCERCGCPCLGTDGTPFDGDDYLMVDKLCHFCFAQLHPEDED